MSPAVKGWSSIIILMALAATAFVFSFRSCLSQFDERSAVLPVLYFEHDSSSILFSLVKFSKTNSYERTRGFTRKTVTYSYFIQLNDAATGEKIRSKEVASDIKHFPEKILGAEGPHAWLFVGELMAFDMFSLEKVADVKMIEAKNPALKGMMPTESEYYEFNNAEKGMLFKANDGAQWIIHASTLMAKRYEQPSREAGENKLDLQVRQLQERLKSLQQTDLSFNQLKVNQDTLNHRWLGIHSKKEMQELHPMVTISPTSDMDERRQFYSGTYDSVRYRRFEIKSPALLTSTADKYYLNAGFLVDKQTSQAIHLKDPAGYLLVYKKMIGQEGEIILSRLAQKEKTLWEVGTGVSKWIDYKLIGNSLVIFANDKKELGNSECSIFLILDLKSGNVRTYDYFKDQIRK